MSSLITNATIQIRKDTAGNWTSNNPTPAAGEWCLETDTGKVKIGDGSTAWTSLGYAAETGIVATVATKATLATYSTAWINISDWTNVELTATHNLSANLSDLIVEFFISTDGTEANAFKVGLQGVSGDIGATPFHVDSSNIKIQTGANGTAYLRDSDGAYVTITNQSWYYKIKVYKLS